jgi:pimeloyl-ACP methyl ester carboxylesterase
MFIFAEDETKPVILVCGSGPGIPEYLQQRFHREKIYLMGHSFGTTVGILSASRYPECYYAYIAMSQICNQSESEKSAYKFMK